MQTKQLTILEQSAIGTFIKSIRLKMKDNVVEMRLFGSRSRQGGNEDSDLDILVLLKKSDTVTKHLVWDIANNIFLDTWINISPLVMTKTDFKKLLDHERLIAKEIERDGITL